MWRDVFLLLSSCLILVLLSVRHYNQSFHHTSLLYWFFRVLQPVKVFLSFNLVPQFFFGRYIITVTKLEKRQIARHKSWKSGIIAFHCNYYETTRAAHQGWNARLFQRSAAMSRYGYGKIMELFRLYRLRNTPRFVQHHGLWRIRPPRRFQRVICNYMAFQSEKD